MSEPSNAALGLIQLMRPKQWVKNFFVLAPVIFTGRFTDLNSMKLSGGAMLLFCLGASAVYILNDLKDLERDRQHPTKSKRPLASGQISKAQAIALLVVLYAVLIGNFSFQFNVAAVVCGYVVLNVAYTFYLKQKPVLDIFTIAIGFVLRVYAGAVALDVPLSGWMFITTLALALHLASVKRLQELQKSGASTRKVLENYTVELAQRFAAMSSTAALVFYSLFVVSERQALIITIPIVLFGLFRYWYIIDVKSGGESPTEALLTDYPLLSTVVLWVLACGWIIMQAKV